MVYTKIHIYNVDSLQNSHQCHLNKKSISAIVSEFLLDSHSSITVDFNCPQSLEDQNVIHQMISSTSASIPIDEINNMKIILNDHDCGDSFFLAIVSQLQSDGLTVATTKNCEGINQDNSTIITIDQQYSAGTDAIVFAPFNNARIGHSDSLVLSMHRALQQYNVSVQPILCGKHGFQKNENGDVQTVFPTDTENAIDNDCDSSFVTFSLGTKISSPETVAKIIENALVRQKYYLNSDDNQTDLIYRANSEDSIDVVANYFGTDVNRLKKYNQLQTEDFIESQPIINPYVEDMHAFDSFGYFQISDEKEKEYS